VIPRIYKAISFIAGISNISIANEQDDSSMYI